MEEEESEAAEAAEELEHRLDKGSTGCSALLFVAEEEEEAEEEAAASVVVDDAANRDETVLVVLCGMCEESHILVSKHKAKNEETPTKMKGGRKSEWDGEGGWWKEEEEEEEKKKKRRDVHTHTPACLLVQTEKKKRKVEARVAVVCASVRIDPLSFFGRAKDNHNFVCRLAWVAFVLLWTAHMQMDKRLHLRTCRNSCLAGFERVLAWRAFSLLHPNQASKQAKSKQKKERKNAPRSKISEAGLGFCGTTKFILASIPAFSLSVVFCFFSFCFVCLIQPIMPPR